MTLAALDARFPNRRAVVTGGASGLGLAAAELLATRGWSLALLDRDEPRLASAAEALRALGSPHCEAFCVDTTDEAAVKFAVDAFAGRLGGLDLALNSAGVAAAGSVAETPPADWRWILDINVLGIVHCCRAEAPHMVAAGRGLIVNVASAAAFMSAPGMGAYNASKAAVVALSETLHQELAADGVHVAVAMPGFFRTRLMEHARAPADARAFAERLMDRSSMAASGIAREVLARAAAGATHLVLPATYRWLWRFKRLAPRSFMRWLARQRWRRATQGG
jgi:NAD(P)-dependent dehydrogenase (short-subunit alcohol dehydrogenase family)